MARTVETIVRDTLGNLQMQIIQLQAALEATQAALEAKADKPPSPPPPVEPPK